MDLLRHTLLSSSDFTRIMFFLGRQKKFNVTSGFLQPILFELSDVLSAGQMPVHHTFRTRCQDCREEHVLVDVTDTDCVLGNLLNISQ